MDGHQSDLAKETLDGEFLEVFEVHELVASNSVSSVFRAHQRLLHREVAIKVIEADDQAAARLRREAKIVSSLAHPNIVKVFSFGRRDAERFYLAMEWIGGGTLADRLRAVPVLPVSFIRELFPPIMEAVRYAHQRGIVHRDLKPSNILLQPTAALTPIVADFGIARSTEPTEESDTITETGVVLGSPLYISPEQCTTAPVDRRADIYSLGAILCECLTGRPPYEGETIMEVMYKHLHEPRETLEKRLLGSDDPALGRIVLRCLARDPADRYSSMDELIAAFSTLPEEGADEGDRKATRSVASRKALLAISVFFVLCVVANILYQHKSTTERFDVVQTQLKDRPVTSAFDAINAMDDSVARRLAYEELMHRAETERKHRIAAFCAAELMCSKEVRSQPMRMKRTSEYFVRAVDRMEPISYPHHVHLGLLIDGAASPLVTDDTETAAECLNAVGKLFHRLGIRGETLAKWHLRMNELYMAQHNYPAAWAELGKARMYCLDTDVQYAFCLLREAQWLSGMNCKKQAAAKLEELRKKALSFTSEEYVVAGIQMEAAALSSTIDDGLGWQRFLDDAAQSLQRLPESKGEQLFRSKANLAIVRTMMLLRFGELDRAEKSIAEARRLLVKVDKVSLLGRRCDETAGEIEFLRGNFDAAQKYFLRCLDGGEELPENADVRARANWCLGSISYRRGMKDLALTYFEAALPVRSCYGQIAPAQTDYLKLLNERGDKAKLAEVRRLVESCSKTGGRRFPDTADPGEAQQAR
ncbi:MAG: serine/threonine protein kinase [Candidatus Obscuribacterales bacterium]|nr:serine/threonine protein kinase [Candidatus Obscuribacterales bacterium]